MRNRYLNLKMLALVALLISTSALAQDVTYIRAGSLFDSRTGDVVRDAVIIVDGDVIRSVGRSGTVIPSGANVIDLSDSFVLPGVMDMHTHVVGNLDPYYFSRYFQSPHRATIGGVVNAEKTLMAGSLIM